MISTFMQKRAGLLFLSKKTKKILLILEESRWTLPTFDRKSTLLEDAESVMLEYSKGRIVPVELYLSEDKGFEYGTYICLVENDFTMESKKSYCWAQLNYLPNQLHSGLRNTLNNSLIRVKIETILELENASTKK